MDLVARQRYSPAAFRAPTFHDAVPRFRDGTDTPRAYLERCLAVIEAREPEVKAWVTLNVAGARQAADAATARWRAGRPLSAIDGMPVGIKDLFETKDMPTGMGSPLFRGNNPGRDSAHVRALREAGAVVLGKTVTTELGMSHPGPTTNPFDPTRTPGGSSSGSAAVIGAGMVPAAIGSQVVGSVIRPASFCANWAIKPTIGALNRGERQGLSHSHLGVHAGSAEDMWRVAIEIALRAGGDPGQPGLYGALAPPAPSGPARLIVLHGEGWAKTEAATREGFARVLAALEAEHVTILEPGAHPLIDAFEAAIAEAMALTRDICAYEMRWTLENLVEKHPGGISDSLMARLRLGRTITLDAYRDLLRRRAEARARLAALAPLADALIAPAALGPAPRLGDTGGSQGAILHTTGDPTYNAASSILGAPSVTVPVMAVAGMPVGVQVMGQHHMDERVVAIARWLAQAVGAVEVG
jgi:Asp-tRNA(Asn)/Glu-tRNA(Gln) amidotransferase A subunit family amidase